MEKFLGVSYVIQRCTGLINALINQTINQTIYISEEVIWDTENESESEEINIVLITEEIDKNEIFIAEASKLAVVDTACTKTVTGEECYMNYIKDLLCELKSQIKFVESNTLFKFGDGHKVFSYRKVALPANIAGINCFIDIELPLLLSKSFFKKANAVIDMKMTKSPYLIKRYICTFLLVDIIALIFIQEMEKQIIMKK